MSRSRQENRIEIVFVDQAIHVDVGEAKAGTRSPVAQQSFLDMHGLERLAQERVVAQIDHPRGEIIARPPVRVDGSQLCWLQWPRCFCAFRDELDSWFFSQNF